jgi:hypothetical protein
MHSFLRYLPGVFIRPTEIFESLLLDSARMQIGALSMLVMSLLYTLVSINLAVIGGTPNPAPWLRIPTEEYFRWASYFYALALISGYVFASAVTHLLARAFGGRGSFEDTFALLGFATSVATLPALVPDLALTFLQVVRFMDYEPWFYSVTHGGAWFYVVWAYLVVYVVCFCVFYPTVVRAVHRLSWPRAALVGVTGFVAYQGFVFIFIR